jgi:redox-sensitive bicupin YhaK (pirin superfamily)
VEGELVVQGSAATSTVPARSLAVLGAGDSVELRGVAEQNRALLLAAATIGEPVARSGPFVMNTPQEIVQAFRDYRAGRLAKPFTLDEV